MKENLRKYLMKT